jgi:serralysin
MTPYVMTPYVFISFDKWQYLASHGDLINAFGNDTDRAIKHYIKHGFKEGRVLDGFDGTTYLDNYDDLMNAFAGDVGMAAQHYVNHGFAEGRVFTPLII